MTERITADRLNVDRRDLDDFKRLRMKDSPFADSENKDIFLAAMVIGFKEKSKIELKNKEGFIMKSYLDPPDIALINSIAIAEEGNLSVLLDEKKVFSIAEQYATGGIKLLKDRVLGVDDFGSYSKKLESEMLREYERIKRIEPREEQSPEELFELTVEELISLGENEKIEFKSSLFYDYQKKQKNKLMEMTVAKSISSFMNARGGIILLGVDDNKNVLGIEQDLKTLETGSLDQFEINFTNVVIKYLGKIPRRYVEMKFAKIKKRNVGIIRVQRSPRPVYVQYKGEKRFYIRQGNCSQPLDVEDAPIYIRDNWPNL